MKVYQFQFINIFRINKFFVDHFRECDEPTWTSPGSNFSSRRLGLSNLYDLFIIFLILQKKYRSETINQLQGKYAESVLDIFVVLKEKG